MHSTHLPWLVGHNLRQWHSGILLVQVDCSVGQTIVKRRDIAQKLKSASSAHRVANETLRVIDGDVGAIFEDFMKSK